uniref:ERVV2 protein n=1 Tax=Podarcis muralis TaxID=64176 RepID=A0A670IE99_PODMU
QGICLRRYCCDSNNNDLLSTWHSNTYVKLISQIARQTTTNECWICANAPSHLHSGIPFLGVPLTLEQHLSADVRSWNLTAVNLTHQYIYLTGPTTGDLCRKFSGNDKVIGESTCKYTLDITLSGRITLWHQGNPSTHLTLLSAWKRVMNLPDSWDPSPISQCFFRTFHTGRIDSCLQGLFWICGHRGYTWASPHSRGTCYLGLILPGVRVTQELPPGKRRNKRAKDLSELSDVAANGETYGRALFPAYGAGSNHVDILKLTDILLNFMEESNAATQSILTELTEVRQNSIQNRLALDYVLASTGGVCALIGTECCTHGEGGSGQVSGHSGYLRSPSPTPPIFNIIVM